MSCKLRYAMCLVIMMLCAAEARTDARKATYTYKKVGDLEIKSDVYRDEGTERMPVLVWIHGGRLINGGREGVDPRAKDEFPGHGYILISIDYRLAPETKVPELITDIEDAFRWIR